MKVRQDPPAANGISGTKGGERPRNHSEISGSYGYGHDRLRGIMILFYGTGGVPGGGEIPMDRLLISFSAFWVRGKMKCSDESPKRYFEAFVDQK